MIFTERTIKISKDTCEIDKPIVLYQGDYNVEVRFTIIESPFKYTTKNSTNIIEDINASYGQLVIKTPNEKPAIFTDVVETNEGSVIFTLSGEMIDETIEVGDYTFQIRLFDSNRESRATIPPVENGISIREPIAIEDVSTTNEVDVATVGYAITTAGVSEDAFNGEGDYNKTTWGTGDRITAAKLNKIESGIDRVNKKADNINNINDITGSTTTTYSSNKIESIKEELSSQIKEIENDGVRTEAVEAKVQNVINEKIADGTMANLTIADGSITKEKLDPSINLEIEDNSITLEKINYYAKKELQDEVFRNFYREIYVSPKGTSSILLFNIPSNSTMNGDITYHAKFKVKSISDIDIKLGICSGTNNILKPTNNSAVYNFSVGNTTTIHPNEIVELTLNKTITNVSDKDIIVVGINSVNAKNDDIKFQILDFELNVLESKYNIDDVKYNYIYSQNSTNDFYIKNGIGDSAIHLSEFSLDNLSGNLDCSRLLDNSFTLEKINANCYNDLVATVIPSTESSISLFNFIVPEKYKTSVDVDFEICIISNNNITVKAFKGCNTVEKPNPNTYVPNAGSIANLETSLEPNIKTKLKGKFNIDLTDKAVVCLGINSNIVNISSDEYSITNIECSINNESLDCCYGYIYQNNGIINLYNGKKALINKSKFINLFNEMIEDFNVESKLKNKIWNVMGDSITSSTTEVYHSIISERTGCIVNNYGIYGTKLSGTGNDSMCNRFINMTDDADIITVFGGTNDFGHNVDLGDITSTDINTFYGGLKKLCEGLIEKYQGKTIAFFTPMPRKLILDNGNIDYESIQRFNLYVNAVEDVCGFYSIPCFNMYKNSGLYPNNPNINSKYFKNSDGLHPNFEGHKLIANKMQNFLESLL